MPKPDDAFDGFEMTEAPELKVFLYVYQLLAHLIRHPVLFWVAIYFAEDFYESLIPAVGLRPVTVAAFVGNLISMPSKILQEFVIQAGRFQGALEVVVDRLVVREDFDIIGVLIAQ